MRSTLPVVSETVPVGSSRLVTTQGRQAVDANPKEAAQPLVWDLGKLFETNRLPEEWPWPAGKLEKQRKHKSLVTLT